MSGDSADAIRTADTDDAGDGAVEVNMTRPRDWNVVFQYNSHDPVVFRTSDGPYLLVHVADDRRFLFEGTSSFPGPTGGSWKPVDADFMSGVTGSSVDTGLRVGDRYYAYRDGRVHVTSDLTADGWTVCNTLSFPRDPGVFYDDATDRFHMFYEAGPKSNHSGAQIGHASSPNGVTNWTVHGPVYTAPPEYGVGDFTVAEHDDRYVILGDYVREHPNYSVAAWTTTALGANLTFQGTVLEPRRNDSTARDSLGVQDPEIEHLVGDRYAVFAHGHVGRRAPRWLHYYEATISIGANDSNSK
ncbi:glycoside hydrolase family protein [Halosimplex halophilum]|uniref:hypothetical protein n=1 Tax=Halosimplex halophilum TaxID=2559572 RepID=UPI00107FD051|nr:hypothetical protein [Halosimplex halophilum]